MCYPFCKKKLKKSFLVGVEDLLGTFSIEVSSETFQQGITGEGGVIHFQALANTLESFFRPDCIWTESYWS